MSSSEESSDESSSASNDHNNEESDELNRLKQECRAMITLLKRLRDEEQDLREKNVMLAREALLCGFQMEGLEAPPPKRKMKPPAVRKEDK